MLTLSDINAATNSRDGDIYSDLHKDVYGFRPRGVTFASTEAFDADFERLVEMLNEQNELEQAWNERNFVEFVARVEETMRLVQSSTRERAIEIIAEAEGIDKEEFAFYGLESLEYKFGLKFGSIAKWLSE